MPRYDRIEGIGRVRAYYAGKNAPFMDKWLVLFEDMASMDERTYEHLDKPRPYGLRQSLSMSDSPSHPQGVSMWDYSRPPDTWGASQGGVRWRRVPFANLPENLQRHVIFRATEPT